MLWQRLRTSLRTSLFTEKLGWTLGIIMLYLIGHELPLATIELSTSNGLIEQDFLRNLAAITGGNFFQLTLFSLGLGPWMTSMILWRFLIFFNQFKQLTTKQSHYTQMSLMLLIGLVQAMGMTQGLSYSALTYPDWLMRLVTVLVLLSGTYVLSWLANLNSHKGLGGAIVIILVNLILTSISGFMAYLEQLSVSHWGLLLLLMGLFSLVSGLIFFTIIIYKAEYRIALRRVTIISDFAEATYIPIRLTPAGAMPYMYGMTLMILPPLLLKGLTTLWPNNDFLHYLTSHLTLSQLPGVLVYIALLFLLSFGFAYYNYDPIEIAKTMRMTGDYISQVRPGRDTEHYIRRYLNHMTFIGAVLTSAIGGFPLLLVLGSPDKVSLALLINNIYIITTMMMGVIEQLEVLRSWRQYKNII